MFRGVFDSGLPIIFNFFPYERDITSGLRNVVVNGIHIPLSDFHFAASCSRKAFPDMGTESVFIQNRIYPKEIRAGFSVVYHLGAPQPFSHKFFIAPGRNGHLSQIGKPA